MNEKCELAVQKVGIVNLANKNILPLILLFNKSIHNILFMYLFT